MTTMMTATALSGVLVVLAVATSVGADDLPQINVGNGSVFLDVHAEQNVWVRRFNEDGTENTTRSIFDLDINSKAYTDRAVSQATSTLMSMMESQQAALSSAMSTITVLNETKVSEQRLLADLDAVNDNIDFARQAAEMRAEEARSTLSSAIAADQEQAISSLSTAVDSALDMKADTSTVSDSFGTLVSQLEDLEEDVLGIQEATSNHSDHIDNVLECMKQGLVHDAETDRCIPAFRHDDCPSIVSANADQSCTGRTFDAVCNITCKTGFAGGGTFRCGLGEEWVPVGEDSALCVDVDECDEGTDMCMGTCTNTEGSYECSCPGGQLAADGRRCQSLNMHFLEAPFNIRLAASSDKTCGSTTISNAVPADAVGVIVALTTFNSARNDHVTHSFGRSNTHVRHTWDNRVYELNTYLNDVIVTQNGDRAGRSYYGRSMGTKIIPVENRQLLYCLSMGKSRGTDYVTLQVYGYLTGEGILAKSEIRNVRRADTGTFVSHTFGSPEFVPQTAAAILGSLTTYETKRSDHYSLSLGRTDDPAFNNWDNEPYTIPNDGDAYVGDVHVTHNGDTSGMHDYYGMSHGSVLVPTRDGGGFKSRNNQGFNGGGTSYFTLQVNGYVPGGGYSNIKFFAPTEVKRLRFKVTGSSHKKYTDIMPPSNVPSSAKGLITLIYTFQDRSNLDHVVHSFGRNAGHQTGVWDNSVYSSNTYLNDILITHEGDNSGRWYYGYYHPTQVIPLKANGQFEAFLGLGRSTTAPHYVTIYVIGYVDE